MLLVPFAAGLLASSPHWLHVPLFVAWFVGYLWSYYALLAVKTRRLKRVRSQVVWYGAVAGIAALVVVLARPAVLLCAPVFAALGAVSVVFARRRDDRSLWNDLALVAQTGVMVALTAWVGGAAVTDPPVVIAAAAVLAYFVGTVLYVKTMIREKGDATYLRASVGYHVVVALVVAALPATASAGLPVLGSATAGTGLGWPMVLVFAWYAVRSAWFPRRDLTPKQVGIVEIFGSLALLGALMLG